MAIALIGAGGVAAALYLAAKHSSHPERPVFSEEQTANKPASKGKNASKPKPGSTPSAEADSPSSPLPLEAGEYRARVIWPQGLLLRDRPSFEATGLGGVPFNEQVVVIEESPDKEWQRVRLESSDLKGWIKGGNTERLNE